VGEVVVQQNDVGGRAGHVGPDHAHGHADVGLAQGRGVVDPVASHGHDLASGLQRLGDAELLFGGDAGQHRHTAPHQVGQGVVAGGELGPEHHRAVAQARLGGHSSRGGRMVAGDHDHPDPGPPAAGDCLGDLEPNWVGHPDQPQQLKALLSGRRGRGHLAAELSPSQGQHPQSVGGEALDVG
jgi:hypothetical protein